MPGKLYETEYDNGEHDNGVRVFQGLITGMLLSVLFWVALITFIVVLTC